MKKIIIGICTILLATKAFNQTEIKVKVETNNAEKSIVVITTPVEADFSKQIKLVCEPSAPGFSVEQGNNATEPEKQNDGSFLISATDPDAGDLTVIVKATDVEDLELRINNKKNGGGSVINGSVDDAAANYFENEKSLSNAYGNVLRYDRQNNTAYFFFDQKGMVVGLAPVNVDADDYFEIYIAYPQSEKGKYSVQVEGEYSPSDLVIRSTGTLAVGAPQSTVKKNASFTHLKRTFGPFTSETTKIKIFYVGKLLAEHTVKVNTLYNVAIGASLVRTNLARPSFDVFPIDGTDDNTIKEIDGGDRSMVTFNVTLYWKSTVEWLRGKLKGNSHITRGRDVLKEPTFWERLNPIIGVAIEGDWKHNIFYGGNFELTRGASISAGWHWGRVQQLVDEKFILGQTVFTGTKDDIKVTNVMKTSGFFALTLDTRIINRLFARN